MTRAFRIVLAVFAIAASSVASATTLSTFNLGVMDPPALRLIGNDFSTVGDFTDEYKFTLSGAADSFGFTFATDLSARRDIDILSLSLWSNGTTLSTDLSPGSFSFSNLSAGAYSLFLSGSVTGTNGGLLGGGLVGYSGSFITTGSSSPTPSTSVPEPATSGIFGLGLLGLFYVLRRKRVS
jgi:hypothetical protein